MSTIRRPDRPGGHDRPGGSSATPRDVVAECWNEVLDGRYDEAEDVGFVSAGGNSLRAARLTALLGQRCGVDVPVGLLLRENISMARLRRFVRAAPHRPDRAGDPVGTTAHSSPLAAEQHRLWAHAQLHPHTAAYNVVGALRLAGRLLLPPLRDGLRQLAERHDVLRARLVAGPDGDPAWQYARDGRLPLEVHVAPADLTDTATAEFVGRAAAAVIPMSEAPLARASLLLSPDHTNACLVLTLNHIIADQTTVDLLLSELADRYSAAREGTVRTPDAAPSFARYAHHADAERRGPRHAEDLGYWRQRLADLPVEMPMPMRRRRPAVPSFQGEAVTHVFDAAVGTRLDARLREHAMTPMSFVLACVAAVASAWSGQHDVVLGVPFSRRRSPEENRLAGLLLSTLPLRITVDPGSSVPALAAQVMRGYVEAVEHAAPTFDAIIDALGIPSASGRNPVFQIWVNDLTDVAPPPRFSGLRTTDQPPPMTSALFDLGWYLSRHEVGYRLQLVRDVELYTAAVAAELLNQVVRLAESAIDHPERSIGAIDLVGTRAKRTLPDPRSVPDAPPDGEDPASAVLATAARFPSRAAIVSPEVTVTYRELSEAVRRTARALDEAGVPHRATVEVAARRCADLPVALLGTWLHGACPALVDVAVPEARIAAARSAIGAAPRLAPAPAWSAEPCLTVPDLPAAPPDDDGTRPSHVLFTSGSTGLPLGVRVPHGPLQRFMGWYTATFGLGPHDRFGLIAGVGHDPVLRDILAPLYVGAQLHVPPPTALTNPVALFDWLARCRVTVVHATPALLELLLAAHHDRARRLTALRLVVCGGAPLHAGLARRVRQLTDAVLVNAYGTTETPQIAACEIVAPAGAPPDEYLADSAVLPVGHGVADHQVLVMTAQGMQAPPGHRGEVTVRGRYLATGYLGPTGAAQRFLPDPAGVPGVRCYRTGDLGYVDLAGRLVVTGRADRQVSIDGVRIELEELEHVALSYPGIGTAVASVRAGADGDRLVLHVVPAPGCAPTADGLRRRLRGTLPRQAIPSIITVVDQVRLNVNHKLDPAPNPDPAPVRDAVGAAAPGTALAQRLSALVRSLLGHPIDPDENFFDAGMTSMTLVRFHAGLVRELRLELPVTVLFTHVTLRALSRYLAGDEQPAADTGRVGPVPDRRAGTSAALGEMASAMRRARARVRDAGTGGP
ncbi:AMP-binding protein [Dactylosporangium roseum]|uniref:AMP-binding protein n=1 Tax=Dactylosporangium roseum TaxID=47989 RepID=A0ABY5ZDC6_9ACTN|nr:AMP-binding protein [Dactylosporangium roseum]UWZ39427.1 AMP-binding protein [Dactylosporangium roseum]